MRPLSLAIYFLLFSSLCFGQYRVQVGDRVATLPSEDYVAGVVTGESSEFKSDEALKAMAVAARSYAARMRGRHSNDGFDFCSTTHCQRFVSPASARAKAAVKATEGEMLWFEDKPAMAMYTRSCGGRSEGMADFPYLVVHSDPYCKSEWSWSGSGSEIVQALRASGLQTPDRLESIGIVKKTASGRAQTLSLSGVLIAASSFRFAIGRAIGWNTLRSDLFEVSPGFTFHGSGEGHGIGLCQRGAEAMGLQGRSYREILAFYYPHTVPFQWTRMAGEHVVVFSSKPESDQRVIRLAERAYTGSQLPWPKPSEVQIWVYPSVETFRNATAEPGWVAARTSGRKIEMQPSAFLDKRGALESTVRHEMLHTFVESAAVPGLPVWFREGLVEWLAGGRRIPAERTNDETAMRQRRDRAAAERGYADADARVAELIQRYGETTVLGWVVRGLPAKYSSLNNAATKSK